MRGSQIRSGPLRTHGLRFIPETWVTVSVRRLVVYLDISECIRQIETERAIAEIKKRYTSSFDQLFVIWNDKLL